MNKKTPQVFRLPPITQVMCGTKISSRTAFATKQGFAFYQLLRPIEVLAKRFIGSDIKTTLLQRHQLIDRELTKLIQQHPDLQILELACGLSPRGWRINTKIS
jgi:O-methyltransferase involved in polyketide biosynthesis